MVIGGGNTGIQTKHFVGDDDGRSRAIDTVEIDWVSENGRYVPRGIPGTEKTWPATLVLLAFGFVGPEKCGLREQLGVRLDARGNVGAGADTSTSVPGVLAAGDMRRGHSLVVWAIAEVLDELVSCALPPPYFPPIGEPIQGHSAGTATRAA